MDKAGKRLCAMAMAFVMATSLGACASDAQNEQEKTNITEEIEMETKEKTTEN